jgi:hypothetical protein
MLRLTLLEPETPRPLRMVDTSRQKIEFCTNPMPLFENLIKPYPE